ncbi:hypothetical protein Micbo1qcDRAFT_226266 [Microdochium bolleyi]|uniref:Zn(2)-C6 fungal-type domain-containing protein n=1 Tax=Microdochium bolleyi TaxID=196109 RepID=A0A136IZW9_9PEZI|nr:hypothetical protein Micbo1qcDRAFT_226266 [Microdochium bolleyi]
MASRQAACDPCRTSKLACDHSRPVCTRCQARGRPSDCTYRATPFKRRRQSSRPPLETHTSTHSAHTHASSSPASRLPSAAPTGPSPYPNPGYQGFSSHATLFNHIPTDGLEETPAASPTSTSPSRPGRTHSLPGPPPGLRRTPSADLVRRGADTLAQLFSVYNLDTLKSLVSFWLEKGISLFLAEPIVPACLDTVRRPSAQQHQHLSELLFATTARPLDSSQATDAQTFAHQFTGEHHTRWETWAIFFTAVGRATFDIPFFPPLYKDSAGQMALRKFATLISDQCLDYCLALDCLNDLQLVLQVENCILHSNVDGDQSYDAWRRLGDCIASLYALGYHQKIETRLPEVPFFLAEFRRSAFAHIYSADKNVAIFLGRPPRISRRFCHFQSPLFFEANENDAPSVATAPAEGDDDIEAIRTWFSWDPNTPIIYRSECRWAAMCAALKEEILELLNDRRAPDCLQRARAVQARAEAQWAALPPHFKLQSNSLKHHVTTMASATTTPTASATPDPFSLTAAQHSATPAAMTAVVPVGRTTSAFERDFLASVRLNYLHVLFLQRLVFMNSFAEPDARMVELSEAILELVVDVVLMRDRLANSGTNLSWKVTYYGLPAVGILLLAIVRRHKTTSGSILNSHSGQATAPTAAPPVNQSKVLRHLIVLVAELETGTLAKPDEPNYGLVSTATETIQGFLNSVQLMGGGGGGGGGSKGPAVGPSYTGEASEATG